MDHGSGFPTIITDDEMLTCELEYAQSPWNLNKLPVLEGSVLQYIDSDISGMKVALNFYLNTFSITQFGITNFGFFFLLV